MSIKNILSIPLWQYRILKRSFIDRIEIVRRSEDDVSFVLRGVREQRDDG
jgi:hypothetical protein